MCYKPACEEHSSESEGRIVCNGATNTGYWPDTTGGSHCVVTTDLTRTGNPAYCVAQGGIPVTAQIWGGFTTATFTEFSNLGSATKYGVLNYIGTTLYGHATDAVSGVVVDVRSA